MMEAHQMILENKIFDSSNVYNLIRSLNRIGRRANRKKTKRTLKRWAWDATDGNFNYGNIMRNMENNENIFLGVK